MISLSKKEILNSLEKTSRAIESICNYKSIPVISFLSDLSIVDIRVFKFISKLRYLSYYEDAFIDSIENDDIDLSDIRNRIFVDKKTKDRFSNKQIIKYIRNSFSHNDSEKELYKISVNGRFLEINLKNTNPCEFHIKMSFSDLESLVDRIRKLNFYLSVFEDNKLKRYYLKGKINNEDFLNVSKLLEENDIITDKEYSKTIIDYYSKNSILYDIKEYDIMEEQLKSLKNYSELFNKSIINNEEKRRLLESFRDYELSKIIPLEEEKLELKDESIFFMKLMNRYPDYSFSEIESEFISTGYNIIENKPLNKIQDEIFRNVYYPHLMLLFNGRDMEDASYMEYISYYIMNMCGEKEIDINGKVYEVEHIRNALAHGRWFIDNDNNLVLCDTLNGKRNDYNFYWKEKIKLFDFLWSIYQVQKEEKNTRVLSKK